MTSARILIVEDEFIVATDLAVRLADLGYEIAGHVDNGPEAIALAGQAKPDLILMDIRLKGTMDGITAAQEIRRQFHLPVVFLTAYAEDTTLQRAKVVEPFGYILKPCQDRELRTILEIALYKQRAEERVRQDARRTELLLELHQRAPRMTDGELRGYVLEKAVQITGSLVGVLHQLSDDRKSIVDTTWSPAARTDSASPHASPYPLQEGGRWVESVRQGRPVVENAPASSAGQEGLLPGPAAVRRFLSVPALEGGTPLFVLGVGDKPADYDETDLHQLRLVANELHNLLAQRAAQRQLRQLSRAVEQSPASILITDTTGAIEYVNPKFTQTTGYTLAEVRGRNPRLLKSGEMPAAEYQRLWTTISQGHEWRGEFRNRKKTGELYWEFASISPITDLAGRITHFVAVKEDITERKRLEVFRQVLLSLGARLNNTRDPLSAGRALFEAADQLWRWDAATLAVWTAQTDHFEAVLAIDTLAGERRELPAAGPIQPTPRLRRILRDGAELILLPDDSSPASDSIPFGDGSRLPASIMCVPIHRETRTVGILSLQSYTPRAYTQADLRTLQALADYCGGALERLRSEQALHTSEERHRGLVETAFDWIWEVDAEARYVYASPKVSEILGYQPKEVLGRTPFDLMPEAEARRVGELFDRIAASRQPFSALENVNRHKNGRLVVLETSGVPIVDPDGAFRGYRGMDRDVTQRKAAEAALTASEERFRTLVEHAPTGIFVQAAERFAYVNQAAASMFGLAAPSPLLGQPILERFAPEHREPVRRRIRVLGEEGRPVPAAEARCVRLDGTVFEAELSAVPLVYDGQAAALVFFQDITERKRLETQFRQAQKIEAIGQLAGGVAHDFNNILAVFMIHLGLLQDKACLDEATRGVLRDLESEARRAANLTRQLLMFSRRSVLAVKPLDLVEVVANLLKMLTRLIGEQVELRFEPRRGLPWVEADAGLLEQVVMNLVVNARDAMPKGGRITLEISVQEVTSEQASASRDRRPGRFICLAVADTGSGMDALTLKRIFEPFFTTKEAGRGTGLGLATVHGIVAQHKGWIEVDSAVGRGTTFRVFLPAVPQPGAAGQPAPPAEPSQRGRETILLVEDDVKVRRLIGQALRALGYQVHEAGNGQEAMLLWQRVGPQVGLLLTDMVMPEGLTGLELTERLQALKPALKVIISSGYSLEIARAGVPTKAGVAYLPKPYEIGVLANLVRQCLEGGGP